MDPHAAAAAANVAAAVAAYAAADPAHADAAYAAAVAAVYAANDSDSDPESIVTEGDYLVRENVRSADSIRSRFTAGLGAMAPCIQVVQIRRNTFPTVMTQARIDAFEIYARATARARDGDANVEHAWFGATNMEEILGIIKHGFGQDQLHGHGLRLSPEDCPILCMARTAPDNGGLKHLLLCRVILGRMAVLAPGSECEPISQEYDSAVHSVSSFKEYFIWSNQMNTHVLPEYVLSYKDLVPTTGLGNMAKRPISPPIPIGTLITALSRLLPLNEMAFISRSYQEFNENIISREVLVQRLRVIAGEKMVTKIIRSFQAFVEKQYK